MKLIPRLVPHYLPRFCGVNNKCYGTAKINFEH